MKFGLSRWLILVVAGMCLGACEFNQPPKPEKRAWTEDVLLNDGTTIQVRRTVEFDVRNSWSGDAPSMEEREATISFLGSLIDLPTWSAPRMALVLYRDKTLAQWVIVATTASSTVWELNGKPKPPYWEYRLIEKKWEEVPVSRGSIGQKTNLFIGYSRRESIQHVTVDDKKHVASDSSTARMYREIWNDPSF